MEGQNSGEMAHVTEVSGGAGISVMHQRVDLRDQEEILQRTHDVRNTPGEIELRRDKGVVSVLYALYAVLCCAMYNVISACCSPGRSRGPGSVSSYLCG